MTEKDHQLLQVSHQRSSQIWTALISKFIGFTTCRLLFKLNFLDFLDFHQLLDIPPFPPDSISLHLVYITFFLHPCSIKGSPGHQMCLLLPSC